MSIIDYDLLVSKGNIGFYNSCEVTQIFLQKKSDKSLYNFYMLIVFEEKTFDGRKHSFLGNRIALDNDTVLGLQRYHMSLEEITTNFKNLYQKNIWCFEEDESLKFGKMRLLSKQFIPAADEQRLSLALKNNFISRSYVLEFFDETKNYFTKLLAPESIKKLNKLTSSIKEMVPIDLSVVRDRIGNIIFQFPITLINVESNALSNWTGIKLKFTWHGLISNLPDCSKLDIYSHLDFRSRFCPFLNIFAKIQINNI